MFLQRESKERGPSSGVFIYIYICWGWNLFAEGEIIKRGSGSRQGPWGAAAQSRPLPPIPSPLPTKFSSSLSRARTQRVPPPTFTLIPHA